MEKEAKETQKRLEISLKEYQVRIDGLVQERRNSSALAMELRLSCTDPLICDSAFAFVDIVNSL